MKKIYPFLLLILFCINIQAQTFDWAKIEGRWAYDYGYGITTDNAGNVYVTGKYEEAAIFSGVTVPIQGNHDIWLAKYSPTGSLLWIKTAGGASGDYAFDVATDNNYVYITGEIEGAGEVIHFEGSAITLTCTGSNDIMLAKYDVNGNLIWARQTTGCCYEKGQGITYDNSGNVYICGFYTDAVTFGGSTTIYPVTTGKSDIFLAKYDANGNFQWVRHAGSAGRDEAKAVLCDASGNIYMCGFYSDGCVMGSQTLTSPNGPWYNAFLAKYDGNGNFQWVKTGGGDYDDVSWGITMDNTGRIYMTGEFNADAYFDGNHIYTTGMADVFVACYTTAGAFQWVKKAGGTLIDRARGIGTDGTTIFITGQFGSTAAFGSSNVSAADSSDIFMAALNSNGDFQWASAVSGPADAWEDPNEGYESGIDITGRGGAVYATGSVLDGATFGSITPNHYTRTDAFVVRMGNAISVEEILAENGGFAIFPNPNAGNFTIYNSSTMSQLAVYNAIGEEVFNKKINSVVENINIANISSGIYFVEVRNDNDEVYRKKILVE